MRRKSKQKERVETKEDFKKLKTIWVRTPIPEETRVQSGNKASTPTRTKIEVMESCKVSISPDVLKEISSSLKSSESGCNEEDEDEEVLVKKTKVKPDLIQKAHKLTSKAVSMSKKKVKDTKADKDSTTASPEVTEKNTLLKSKIRKKIEKIPQATKLDKRIESEKNNFMEPSFRILEREISNFQQKIREFGDKKLKIIKRDTSKKDKEFKSDDGSAYDVSKKCEITVKKIKKHTSRECSPTKISVEQKSKNNDEDNSTLNKEADKQQKQNTSSSDFEDFDKLRKEPINLNEKIVSTTKMQTRSRSKLRKQMHLQNSSTRSESEKVEKSEDKLRSEIKTDKLKDSSSSLEMKMDSTSCSSRDFGKQQNQTENQKMQKSQTLEKKNIRNQRLTSKLRPTGIVETKRKVPSLESKTADELQQRIIKKDEKLDINKTSTSDDSKSTSSSKSKVGAYHKKSIISEEKKPNQEIKSSISKESMTIGFDKLVEEVKEIPLLIQETKNSINVMKTNEFITDNKTESLENPLKLKEGQKTEATSQKKSQEIAITPNIEQNKMLKSVVKTDSNEKIKDQIEKSNITKSTSPSQLKTDDEISFTVIDKNKITSYKEMESASKNYDVLSKDSKNSEEFKLDFKQDDNKIKYKENINIDKNDLNIINTKFMEESIESKEVVTDKIDDTEKLITDKIDESNITVSNKMDELIKNESNESIKDTKMIPAKIKTEKNRLDNADETGVLNQVSDSKNIITHEANETSKIISHTIGEIKEIMFDSIDESEKNMSNKIEKTQAITSNEIVESKKMITDKIDENKKTVSDQISDVKTLTDKMDDFEKMIGDEINESKTNVSNKIDDTVKKIDNETNKSQIIIKSDTIDEGKQIVIDHIDKIKDETENISDNINESEKVILNKNEESRKKINDIMNNKIKEVNETPLIDKEELISVDVDKKSEEKDTTIANIVDSTMDILDKTIMKNQDNVNIMENMNLEQNLLKQKSTCLPIESTNENEKQIDKNNSIMNINKIDNDIEKSSSAMDEMKVNKNSLSSLNTNIDTDSSKELIKKDNINASSVQQEETCTKKSISTLNGSFKEKEKEKEKERIESTEVKRTIEDKVHEEIPSKEDYISSSNSNKGKEASSTEMTQLKEMKEFERLEKQETKKIEFISTSASDKARETTMEDSQLKQMQDQVNKVKATGRGASNEDKLLDESEECKTKCSSLSAESTEANVSIKAYPQQASDPEKANLEQTNASSPIKETGEESEEDSSSATDVSNKTALRTKPYSTPRHSISSDDIGITSSPKFGKTSSSGKSNGKTRQKWNPEREKDPLLQVAVQQPRESSVIDFPQKMETTPLDKSKISANKATLDQAKMQKSPAKDNHAASKSLKSLENAETKVTDT
jgi:hypothetical protein